MLVAVAPILLAAVHSYLFNNDENDLSVDESVGGSRLSQCPPWFVPDNLIGTCRSGPTLDGLIEQDLSLMQTSVMNCYCMTERKGSFSVGYCPHSCFFDTPYYSLPCNISELEIVSCPPNLNRCGYLCSQCIKGHGFPAYSYSMGCVKCDNHQYNWLKYLAVAYLPLALFYVFVALFSINFLSPTLSGVVIISQTIMNPYVFNFKQSPYFLVLFSLGYASNLDFLRNFYIFCLYPSASIMTIHALEFALAIFPFFLILLTFLLVKAYDHNLRLVVWMWKAFHNILKPVRRNVKTSLIEVFATFIYLSCSRLLWTSMYFLILQCLHLPHIYKWGCSISKTLSCDNCSISGIFWKGSSSICTIGYCCINMFFHTTIAAFVFVPFFMFPACPK